MLAVDSTGVRSASLGSVGGSVGAVNSVSRSESNLSVVQSASKGVSTLVVSDGSLWEEGCADVVASSISSVPQSVRSFKRESVGWVASSSSHRAVSITVSSANTSSRRRSVWAVKSWVSKSRGSSVVNSASKSVSCGIRVRTNRESSANCQTIVQVRIKGDVV